MNPPAPITVALSLGLVASSVALLVLHLRAWRDVDNGGLSDAERIFHHRLFRRRMRASGMIGLIGCLLLADLAPLPPNVAALYWSGVLGLVLWTMLQAALDYLSIRRHYSQKTADLECQREVLKAEIERYHRQQRESGEPGP